MLNFHVPFFRPITSLPCGEYTLGCLRSRQAAKGSSSSCENAVFSPFGGFSCPSLSVPSPAGPPKSHSISCNGHQLYPSLPDLPSPTSIMYTYNSTHSGSSPSPLAYTHPAVVPTLAFHPTSKLASQRSLSTISAISVLLPMWTMGNQLFLIGY